MIYIVKAKPIDLNWVVVKFSHVQTNSIIGNKIWRNLFLKNKRYKYFFII